MIRVIIALIIAFIVWVLFFSKFSKERKFALVVAAISLSLLGFWFESVADKPRINVLEVDQVISCGVSAKHSYRTNFEIDLCIRNTAESGVVKRLSLFIVAERCSALGSCIEIQRVERDLSVEILAGTSVSLAQNLSFEKVKSSTQDTQWSFLVRSVKASK